MKINIILNISCYCISKIVLVKFVLTISVESDDDLGYLGRGMREIVLE